MRKYTLLLIMAIVSGTLFASAELKDSVQLSDLVVTGTKAGISRKVVPLSVSQISRQEIESTGQLNILPALNTYIPGVFVTERNILGFGVAAGGSGGINMRGIGGSPNTGVLILIDGHPQYQGIFGHPLADAYVASDVEKVEVIRGPGSILYGSNAMGGVINIITRKNTKEGLIGSLGASYGSYNTQKYYGTLGYKYEKLSVFASVNHDQTDGIRSNTDFNITNGFTKAGYELNKHLSISADISIAKFNANDNGSVYLAPAPFNIDILRGKVSASFENKYENLEGALKVYHNFGEHTLSDGFHSVDRNSGAMLYQTLKLAAGTSITAGADFKQYGGEVNVTTMRDSMLTVNELAMYAYAQQTLFKKLTLSAGLRLENNSQFGSELVPLGGLSYVLSDKTSFKVSVSKGFRSPTVMEMYLYAPNPDLQPERMINYEVSWLQSFLNNKLNLELTTYRVIGKNLIQVVVPPMPAKRQNVGTFDNKGVEFMVKYVLADNLKLHANYSYIDMVKNVVSVPRQQINIGTDYSYKIWSLHATMQHIDKLYTNIASPTTQSYTLLNARLACRPIKKLELFVAGNNLLNQTYQINYGYPMPGINFNGGIKYSF